MKIRCGDEVIVLSGKDKKKRGQVLSVFPKSLELIVQGIGLVKRNIKPNPQAGIEGGQVAKERRLPCSKVAILNKETGKADRIGFRIENGKKARYFKSTGSLIA